MAFGQHVNIVVDQLQEIYKGIGRSITIEVHDCNCDDIRVESDKAEIVINDHRPDNKLCHYMIFPTDFGLLKLNTFLVKNNISKHIGSETLKVIRMPDPIIKVANRSKGFVMKSELKQQVAVVANLVGVPFCGTAKVTEFTVLIDLKEKCRILRKRFTTNRFNEELRIMISEMDQGDDIYFLDMKCVMPDGLRDLSNVVRLTIKN